MRQDEKHRRSPRVSKEKPRSSSLNRKILVDWKKDFALTRQSLAIWLGRFVLLSMLVVSPWYYGLAQWDSQLWLPPAAAVALCCAVIAAGRSFVQLLNPLSFSLLGLVLLALIQCIPLTPSVWEAVAPAAAFDREIKAMASDLADRRLSDQADSSNETADSLQPSFVTTAVVDAGRSLTLSIYQTQTLASASIFAAGVAVLLASGVLFRGVVGNLSLLSVLGVVSLSHALLGIYQCVAWDDWTLFTMPKSETFFSTFVSRNTAPQYYACGIAAMAAMLAWWLRAKSRRDKEKRYHVRYPAVNLLSRLRRRLEELLLELDVWALLAVISIAFLLVAAFAAGSRGGFFAGVAAIVITLSFTLGRNKIVIYQTAITVVLLAGVATILLTTLDLDERLVDRLDGVASEINKDNARLAVWKMAISQKDFWLTGCGLGCFHFGILQDSGFNGSGWFYHAESIYVEVLTEFGGIGFFCMCWGLIWLAQKLTSLATKKKNQLMYVATVFVVSAVGLQSLVDFSLIIPAIFLPVAMLVGTFLGDSESHSASTEQKQRDKQEVRAAKPQLDLPLVAQLFAVLSILALCMLLGFASLIGFASAERINRLADVLDDREQQIDTEATQRVLASLAGATHPEVRLAKGRLLQALAEIQIERETEWPEEIPAEQRAQLSELNVVAAALRSSESKRLAVLRELLLSEADVLNLARDSNVELGAAYAACQHDWRAIWGVIRSDFGQLTDDVRADLFIRLSVLARANPKLQLKAGILALWTGDQAIAIEILKRLVQLHPATSNRLIPYVSEGLDASDLQEILNTSELSKLSIARSLIQKNNMQAEVGKEILTKLSRQALVLEADTAKDWSSIAWLDEQNEQIELAIDSLKLAARKAPMDHRLRFRLAKLFEANGEIDEAILQVEQAVRRSQLKKEYAEYLSHLKELAGSN